MPERAYHEYDYPPASVRHLSAERLPSVSCNPLGSASNSTMAASSSSGGRGGYLGGRRQSWTDLVAASEASSVSDLSLANASFNQSFGPLPTGDADINPVAQLGPRRASWLNLMESDENIHSQKVDRLPNVYHKPPGRAMTNLHKANPANRHEAPGQFRFLSASQSDFQRHHNDRKESGGSSPNELIFIPQPSICASALPRKPNFSGGIPLVDGPGGDGTHPRVYRCPCGPRNFLAILLAACTALIVAVAAALVLRHFAAWPFIYHLKYHGRPGEKSVVVVDMTEVARPSLHVRGDWPFQDVKTTIDFQRRKVVAVDRIIPDYCFITNLNASAMPSSAAFRAGIHTTYRNGTPAEPTLWRKEWRLVIQQLHPQLRDSFLKDFPACGAATNVFALKDSFRDNRGSRCPACSEICLPDYAVDSNDPEKATFRIRTSQCFWLHVPEWAKYAEDSGSLGSRHVLPSSGRHRNPVPSSRPAIPWVFRVTTLKPDWK